MKEPECAKCSIKERMCQVQGGKGPEFCPMENYDKTIETALKEYERPEVKEFAKLASIQESECYANRDTQPYVRFPVKPRVQEVCEFAKKMGYKKLGIGFCGGLRTEAGILSQILETQGFEVISVACKIGGIPKEQLGLREEEKVRRGQFEPMCNPITQATILNEAKTEFNILVGLCVGHDSLFLKYSEALCTVLIAKDRVLGHNPAAALYASGSYYSRMLHPGF